MNRFHAASIEAALLVAGVGAFGVAVVAVV
jgi:hypothetical protein